MLTNWCCGFGAAPWECHYFSLSLVFIGLKCAQASRVSVYLSAFTFLSVVFTDFLPRFCFLFSVFTMSICFLFVFFLSLLLLFLHLLRVHSCWGFVCTFVSFVEFPFFFWRVSCEKGFSPFLILIFALGAKVSICISESFGRSGYIPCRTGKDGGFIRRDVPSIYQGST